MHPKANPTPVTSPSPRTDDDNPKASHLRLPLDIIIAPARAFERIAAKPEWLVAYVVVAIVAIGSGLLEIPALMHLNGVLSRAQHKAPAAPSDMIAGITLNSISDSLFAIMITTMTIAVIAVVRNMKNLSALPAILSLVANVAVIAWLGELLGAIAVRLHDPASFNDVRSLDMALPLKLTFLAAAKNGDQATFLSHFGVFDLWAQIVLAFGLVRLVKFDLTFALVLVFAIDLVLAFVF